jgi:hypothetical protein
MDGVSTSFARQRNMDQGGGQVVAVLGAAAQRPQLGGDCQTYAGMYGLWLVGLAAIMCRIPMRISGDDIHSTSHTVQCCIESHACHVLHALPTQPQLTHDEEQMDTGRGSLTGRGDQDFWPAKLAAGCALHSWQNRSAVLASLAKDPGSRYCSRQVVTRA